MLLGTHFPDEQKDIIALPAVFLKMSFEHKPLWGAGSLSDWAGAPTSGGPVHTENQVTFLAHIKPFCWQVTHIRKTSCFTECKNTESLSERGATLRWAGSWPAGLMHAPLPAPLGCSAAASDHWLYQQSQVAVDLLKDRCAASIN